MIRLNLKREPEWLELVEGVRVKVAPLTSSIMMAARRDPEVAALTANGPADDAEAAISVTKALARLTILAWEGIGDDAGEAVPVTPEAVDALMEIWTVFEAFQAQYLAKGLALDAEKNG